MATSKPLRLWERGAPGADSASPHQEPTITPYPVESDRLVGAVIVCPGGGYGHLADHEGEPIARWLNSLGIAAFVCHYRIAPYRHPWPSTDARRAIRWVRAHAADYGIDPAKVGILGFSAGGHLASYVATHADDSPPTADPIDALDGRPDCAILCYPVISFDERWGHAGSGRNLLGRQPTDEDHQAFSNNLHVDAATPPCFLWHTADDAAVSVESSLRFAIACRAAAVPCEVHVFPHGRHGLGLASDDAHVSQWTTLCANWLHTLAWA